MTPIPAVPTLEERLLEENKKRRAAEAKLDAVLAEVKRFRTMTKSADEGGPACCMKLMRHVEQAVQGALRSSQEGTDAS